MRKKLCRCVCVCERMLFLITQTKKELCCLFTVALNLLNQCVHVYRGVCERERETKARLKCVHVGVD